MNRILIAILIITISCNLNDTKHKLGFIGQLHPHIRQKIDSTIKVISPEEEYFIYTFHITRLSDHTNFIFHPVADKDFFVGRPLPRNYEFYSGKLVLIYTGEEFISKRKFNEKEFIETFDSLCVKKGLESLQNATFCPSFLYLSVYSNGTIATMPLRGLDIFYGRHSTPGFVFPSIKEN